MDYAPPFQPQRPAFAMLHLLAALFHTLLLGVVMAIVCLAAGAALFMALARRRPTAAEACGPAFLLGFMPFTALAALLVPLGGLSRPPAALGAAGVAAAALLYLRGRPDAKGLVVAIAASVRCGLRARPIFAAGLLLFAGLQLASCAAPNTGWDAFTYHYGLVDLFRTTRSLKPQGVTVYEYWHLNSELLNALWISAGGERMANVFYLVQTLSFAATGYWGVRRLGADEGGGWCVALTLLGFPVVAHQAAGGWADALLVQSILCCFLVYEFGQDEPAQSGWAVMAGACGAYAWGVKQSTPLFLAPWVALALWDVLKGKSRYALTALVWAGILAAPWILRTWIATGNPFFPAFKKLTRLRVQPNLNLGSQLVPIYQRPFVYLGAHLNPRFLNGDSIPIWTALVAAAGALRFRAWRRTRHSLRLWLCSGALFGLCYLVFPSQPRYALPLFVLALLPAAAALKRTPVLLSASAALSLLLALGISAGKAWNRVDVLTGAVSGNRWVEARYSNLELLARARAANRIQPGEALIVMDGLRYRTAMPTYDADPRWPAEALASWSDPAEKVLANWRSLNARWLLMPYDDFARSYAYAQWSGARLLPDDPEQRMAQLRTRFPKWELGPAAPPPSVSVRRAIALEDFHRIEPHLELVDRLEGVALYRIK